MPLEASFSTVTGGGPVTLDAKEVVFTRCLGRPAGWLIRVSVIDERRSAGHSEAAAVLMRFLEQLVVEVVPRTDNAPLGPPGVVESARWFDPKREVLELSASVLGFHRTRPNGFRSRRRVLRAQNMLNLVKMFKHLAIPDDLVGSELASVRYPDGARTSVVQDGLSDWQYLCEVLAQCHLLRPPDSSWSPLALVGSAAPRGRTMGKWLITSPSVRAYERLGRLEGSYLALEAFDNLRRGYDFGGPVGTSPSSFAPTGAATATVREFVEREFDENGWAAWCGVDLPRFIRETRALVNRIDDRVAVRSGDSGDLGWKTVVHSVPATARAAAFDRSVPVRPWTGTGVVVERSATEPWLEVRLDGFERGQDVASVKMTTSYSGADGKKGLHFVPETNTQVAVAWSGRIGESLFLLGNTRSTGVALAAPSLWLEERLTGNLDAVTLESIGTVEARSNVEVVGRRRVKVEGDGARIELSGGRVRTGRA